jgi:hypothetical protein
LNNLERNKNIRHTHGKEICVIERFFINILWKGIILYLWIHAGVRLDVLWKGNIIFMWVRENDFIFMIVGDSDFSWPWDRLHWNDYLFSCIKRTSKSEDVRVLCVNLKAGWSWNLNWKQIYEVNKRNLDKLERNKDIRYTHGK